MITKEIKILGFALSVLILGYFGFIKAKRFIEIDSCLDKGGSWNDQKQKCEFFANPKDEIYGYFDQNKLNNSRFASGINQETKKKIRAKIFQYSNYTIVTGFPNDSGSSSLGLYYGNKEIFYEISNDSYYDTVFNANLNNDLIPDFIISYAYEDGHTLRSLVSSSNLSFKKNILFGNLNDAYCINGIDTLKNILPPQIRDINKDNKDDIIVNLVEIDNKTFAISCTDTLLSESNRMKK